MEIRANHVTIGYLMFYYDSSIYMFIMIIDDVITLILERDCKARVRSELAMLILYVLL